MHRCAAWLRRRRGGGGMHRRAVTMNERHWETAERHGKRERVRSVHQWHSILQHLSPSLALIAPIVTRWGSLSLCGFPACTAVCSKRTCCNSPGSERDSAQHVVLQIARSVSNVSRCAILRSSYPCRRVIARMQNIFTPLTTYILIDWTEYVLNNGNSARQVTKISPLLFCGRAGN